MTLHPKLAEGCMRCLLLCSGAGEPTPAGDKVQSQANAEQWRIKRLPTGSLFLHSARTAPRLFPGDGLLHPEHRGPGRIQPGRVWRRLAASVTLAAPFAQGRLLWPSAWAVILSLPEQTQPAKAKKVWVQRHAGRPGTGPRCQDCTIAPSGGAGASRPATHTAGESMAAAARRRHAA